MRPVMRSLVLALATGFGTGYCPKAPGTAGTLLGAVLYFGLSAHAWSVYVLAVGGMMMAGVWLCGQAAEMLRANDPKEVVWDEMVGYLVAMAAAPRGWAWAAAGFVLFRILDIAKPGPIGWAERRFSGGFGIMADDVLAGVLTLAALAAAEGAIGLASARMIG